MAVLKMPASVVAEVRRTKVKLLEPHNYDLDAMVRDARARQSRPGRVVVDRSAAPQASGDAIPPESGGGVQAGCEASER